MKEFVRVNEIEYPANFQYISEDPTFAFHEVWKFEVGLTLEEARKIFTNNIQWFRVGREGRGVNPDRKKDQIIFLQDSSDFYLAHLYMLNKKTIVKMARPKNKEEN